MRHTLAVALLLAVAAAVAAPSQATKSRAGCPCSRIYKPVCNRSGSPMAPNRCEAACLGLGAADSNEEWCNASKTPICNCPANDPQAAPVCDADGKQVAESRCFANCQQLPERLFSEIWCPQPASDKEEASPCGCPETHEPVCDVFGKEVAGNKCEAECKGLTWGTLRAIGYCMNRLSPPPDSSPRQEYEAEVNSLSCSCPDTNEPVCDVWGKEVARNKCEAACRQLTWGSIFAFTLCSDMSDNFHAPVNFGGEQAMSMPALLKNQDVTFDLASETAAEEEVREPAKAFTEPEPAVVSPCVCTLVYIPVCDVHGKQVAPSPCQARCMGLNAGTYSEDWCGSALEEEEKQQEEEEEKQQQEEDYACDCPLSGRPVCASDGRQVAVNRCFAWCQGLRPGSFSTWNCYHGFRGGAAEESESSSGSFSWSSQESSTAGVKDTATNRISNAWSSSEEAVWRSPSRWEKDSYNSGAPSPAPAAFRYEWDAPLYLDLNRNEDFLLAGVEDELLEDEALLPTADDEAFP